MTCFDFAEGLRVPVRAGSGAVKAARAHCEDPETDERARLAEAVREVEADIAILILEGPAAEAETKVEKQRQEIVTATNTIADLEVQIGTLRDAVAKAEALGEQRRQEAVAACKRADNLVTDVFELTSELVEMRKRIASRGSIARENESVARQPKMLTMDEARRVAAIIARLPELLGARREE